MNKKYVHALILDKKDMGIDPVIRNSLKVFCQRYLYIDSLKNNPTQSIISDQEDVCLDRASQLGFDYLIMTWEGNIFDIYNFHNECISFIEKLEEDWLVAGHIIDQEKNRILFNDPTSVEWENSFWLFPITALVNIKKWEELGKPKWGNEEGIQSLYKAIPSKECIHDNYTPLNLMPSNTICSVNTKKGWHIINAAISNNIKIFNISEGIRNNQSYLYPENDIKKYNNFWNSIFTLPKLTPQYEKVFDKILTSKNPTRIRGNTWQCFIRNTEQYFPFEFKTNPHYNYDLNNIDTFILPSSGFKDFIITMSKYSARKIVNVVHFDIINQCVEIRKKIIDRWDGKKETFENTLLSIGAEYNDKFPIHTFHMHSMKNLIEAYEHILLYFNDEKDLEDCWLKFKSFNHSYIETDILENPNSVIKLIKTKNIYICLSDIAGWRQNIIGYGYKNLRSDIINIIFNLNKKELIGYIDYKDPGTDIQVWQNFNDAVNYLNQPLI